jgi:hypothetical protein
MKKEYENKNLKSEESKESIPAPKEGYVCVRECDMPGVALFKVGAKIYDPGLVKIVKDNPNFEKIEEEKI